ncbi:MAG: hypothetical protein JWR83_3375 [Aeromicrobium sp.]|nr:hypothetical protein [Aeromicrobium sp.]
MHDRNALGPANVDDATLTSYVAASLGRPQVSLLDSRATAVDYALTTMTTGARFWVEGKAEDQGVVMPYRFFVKVAQNVARSPMMEQIPSEFHAPIAENLPWQIEPNAYRSVLPDVVPDGMRLPRCHDVRELDEESAAMWLEVIDHDPSPWGLERYRAAARMLGRYAADERVTAIDPRLKHPAAPNQARIYFEARLRGQFIAAYSDADFWRHPIVAASVDSQTRDRLLTLVARAPALIEEIEALPLANIHGDACPQNLLVVDDGFAVIDWSFWGRSALGFDLSQLVISNVELGQAPAASLPGIQQVCLEGYRAGLADSGLEVATSELARAHAVLLAIAAGIQSIPVERLGDPDTPELRAFAAERVSALRHILDGVGL